ncbi:MAG: hypothetical protein CMI31_02070 [Opitutae bacterium]|nr:hypothetical protein [Opitutae bacterium]|tara:strand:- start:326 stop:640 length:315 start_codon:yes stop_codon:yes gene_type:complete
MVGVGKLLKQAQKMQKSMAEAQEKLAEQVLEVSSGGGAITVKINGQGEFQSLSFDPEFLKEDPEVIEEATLSAVREAADKAKQANEKIMEDITGGMGMGLPGFM